MDLFGSEEFLAILAPVVVYWVYSGLYAVLGSSNNYRLHSKREEDLNNLVSKKTVVTGVLFQQALNAAIAYIFFALTSSPNHTSPSSTQDSSLVVVTLQFLVAMIIYDGWQYLIHRFTHANRFMYRHFHSWHHRLVVPYPFGAQYNHPIDGLLNETVAAALVFTISGMSARTSIYFFSFAAVKGVDDHCGYMMPWNPFHVLFGNNAAYHDVHHQLGGGKCNFAQPFFTTWDKVFGTYAPYSLERMDDGGYQIRIVKDGPKSN